MSSFDVTKYDGAYLCCAYVPCAIKFTAFTDESLEKNKSVSSKHGGFNIWSWIARERLFKQIYTKF